MTEVKQITNEEFATEIYKLNWRYLHNYNFSGPTFILANDLSDVNYYMLFNAKDSNFSDGETLIHIWTTPKFNLESLYSEADPLKKNIPGQGKRFLGYNPPPKYPLASYSKINTYEAALEILGDIDKQIKEIEKKA